jgi:hypothetical protein
MEDLHYHLRGLGDGVSVRPGLFILGICKCMTVLEGWLLQVKVPIPYYYFEAAAS